MLLVVSISAGAGKVRRASYLPPAAKLYLSMEKTRRVSGFPLLFSSNAGPDLAVIPTKREKVNLPLGLTGVRQGKIKTALGLTSPYRTPPHLWENGQDLSPGRRPANLRRRGKLAACQVILLRFFGNAG